jgi:hypothetical protein
MSIAIVVEYQVQNDTSEVMKQQCRGTSQVGYPNMYILPKKYENVRDVKIADVIRSMPLQSLGSDG